MPLPDAIRCWVITNHERMDVHEKRKFFLLLKFEPEQALRTISANLPNWVTTAALECNLPAVPEIHDFSAEAEQLAEAFRKRFKNELDAILEPKK